MKKLTSAFFVPPKMARKAEARLRRARLAVVAARTRRKNGAAICGKDFNSATPSHRIAETPLG